MESLGSGAGGIQWNASTKWIQILSSDGSTWINWKYWNDEDVEIVYTTIGTYLAVAASYGTKSVAISTSGSVKCSELLNSGSSNNAKTLFDIIYALPGDTFSFSLQDVNVHGVGGFVAYVDSAEYSASKINSQICANVETAATFNSTLSENMNVTGIALIGSTFYGKSLNTAGIDSRNIDVTMYSGSNSYHAVVKDTSGAGFSFTGTPGLYSNNAGGVSICQFQLIE